jgi:hypothetical protein
LLSLNSPGPQARPTPRFGADYPFEDRSTATASLRQADLSEHERERIAHRDAEQLPGLRGGDTDGS